MNSALPHADQDIRTRSITVDGIRTEVTEVGAGPPLIFLPSPLIRVRTYQPSIVSLARHFRVVAVDLPGSGRSERVADGWDFDRYADWTARFLDDLAIPRPVVLGHSNSAAVALLLAARHPGRVGRLVLVDSVGARADHSFGRISLGRLVDGLLEMRLNFQAGPHVIYNLLVHRRNFFHQIRLAVVADVLPIAPSVSAPTLLAWGRRDHTMPPACAERLQKAIPDSRIYLSEGSHDWLILRPDELAGVVSMA